MKYIISWGGGVNSTAILAMIKLGMLPMFTKDNSIFVFGDTVAEMPHTYEHTITCLVPMVRDGWQVKIISPERDGHYKYYSKRMQGVGLIDYCLNNTIIPSRVNRWCTMEYKSNPIRKFREELETDITLVLGISHEEQHRAKARYAADTCYPLIEQRINRDGCKELIVKAGLPEARKTGCYFCPYQRKAQWLELYTNHKDLFDIAQKIEDNARVKYEGKAYFFIRDLRLTEQIQKWLRREKEKCKQQTFEDFGLDQHCFCAD